MIRSILKHVRRSTLAYLALFLSLGMGTAYAAQAITSADIVDGEVKRPDIAANAVTSGQIVNHSLTAADIGPDAVVTEHIRAGAVRGVDVAPDTLTGGNLLESSIFAGGDLTGSLADLQLTESSVERSALADNAVGAEEIGVDAVTTDELATGAVKSVELADDAVQTSDIAQGAVDSDEIAASAVGTEDIAANAVDSSEIAANAVGPSEIATLPGAIACCSGRRSIPSDTAVVLQFPRLVTDADPTGGGVFDPAQPARLTAPVAGLYQVEALLYWEPDPDPKGFREVGIRCHGCQVAGEPTGSDPLVAHDRAPAHGQAASGLLGDGTTGQVASASALVAMKAGDYVEALVFQNSGGSLEIGSQDPLILSPAFSLTWVAPTS